MKHPLKFIVAFFILLFFVTCSKEDQPFVENQVKTHKYFNVDDFDPSAFLKKYSRDGGQNPFLFITSGLLYDPFKPGSPQTAMNLQKVVKSEYFRISEPNANAWDTEWDVYNVTFYFTDGTTKYFSRVYVENSIGATYTHYHNVAYNQLPISNPNNYVILVRGRKYEKYIDNECGIEKRRFEYINYFGRTVNGVAVLDSIGVSTLQAIKCNSSVLSYNLITIP